MKMRRHSIIDSEEDRSGYGQLGKGIGLLEALAAGNPMSLGDLAERCDLPKATAHRLITMLCDLKMARVTSEGAYGLGQRCLSLGSAYLANLDLRQEAGPIMKALVKKIGETAHLGILDGNKVVLIEKVEPDRSIRMVSRLGSASPLHATSIGKVLLAHCEDEYLQKFLAAGLEKLTANTITDISEFRFALKRVQNTGYAINDIEYEEGIRCVGAPVRDHEGTVIAGLSVSCPDFRTPRDRLLTLAPLVADAAEELSLRLGYQP